MSAAQAAFLHSPACRRLAERCCRRNRCRRHDHQRQSRTARARHGSRASHIPAMPNVHSHAHQRLMAGLAERAGPGADSFWTWREVMYGFALRLGPEDLAGGRRAALCRDAEKRLLDRRRIPVSASTSRTARPMTIRPNCRCAALRRPSRPASPSPCCRRSTPMAALAASRRLPGQRRFINDADRYLRILEQLHAACRDNPLAQARHLAAFAARRHHGTPERGHRRARPPRYGSARSIFMLPSRPRKSTTASPGRASGRSNI